MTLESLRKYIYDYYVNHIDSDLLFKSFLNLVILDEDLNETIKYNTINDISHFQYLSSNGNKTVIHTEAFIFKFLYNLKKYKDNKI